MHVRAAAHNRTWNCVLFGGKKLGFDCCGQQGRKLGVMMADAEEGSSGVVDDLFCADDKCDDVYLDLDSFWKVMGPASPSQVIFNSSVCVFLVNSNLYCLECQQ